MNECDSAFLTPKVLWTNHFSEFEDLLLSHGNTRHIPSNQTINGPGEVFPYACYVAEGLMKMSILHRSGYEKTALFIGKGGMTPLYSPMHKYKLEYESLTITSLTDVSAITIPQDELLRIMLSNPAFHLRMTDVYVLFVNLLLYESINQAQNSTITKTANFLIVYTASTKRDVIYLNQAELTAAIGDSRANVSRALKLLREEGTIRNERGKLRITNRAALLGHCSEEVAES